MSTVIVEPGRPGCLVQVLWFILVGWWAGFIWITISWLLLTSVVGIPLAAVMLNSIPMIIALRGSVRREVVVSAGEAPVAVRLAPVQYSVWLRALWFLLVGSWASYIWMQIAYFLCIIVIGLPIGFAMFDVVPTIATLRRS